MAGKHNVRHNRSRSHYPERLAARDLSHSPVMPDLDALRARASKLPGTEQKRRAKIAAYQLSQPLVILRRG